MRREMMSILMVGLLVGLSMTEATCAPSLGQAVAMPGNGRYSRAAWSPAGMGMALAGEKGRGLYCTDMAGNMATISDSPMSGSGFSWSPDGRQLAYRGQGENGGVAIMVTDDQGKQKQLTPFVDSASQFVWTKDGLTYKAGDEIVTVDAKGNTKKVFSLSQGRGLLARIMGITGSLMAARVTGATLTALTSISASGPSLDAKGEKKAFVDSESRAWVVDENGNLKKLIDIDGVQGYAAPIESPGQGEYAVHGFDGNLYVADPNGSQPINLGQGGSPTWSPDGQYIIYTRSTDDGARLTSSELWIARADGSWMSQLSNDGTIKESPTWSPDGKQISYLVDGVVYTAPIDR